MYHKINQCPNPKCKFHDNPDQEIFYIKKGYFKTKFNYQPVPRYKCKSCGCNFSAHSDSDTYRQHKPFINKSVFDLFSSGVTLRRAAIILKVHKKTIERKFSWLADKAKMLHEQELQSGNMTTSYVQFDEMETCQGNKKRPLSISLAIRAKTGQIIDAKVAKMRLKGKLATLNPSNRLYWNEDNREEKSLEVMESVKKVAKANITIASDKKKSYPNIIHKVLPNAIVEAHDRLIKNKKNNPLFRLNVTCAKRQT